MRLDDGRTLTDFVPEPRSLKRKIRSSGLTEKERNFLTLLTEETLGYEAFKDKDTGESVRRTSKKMSANYLSKRMTAEFGKGYSKSTIDRLIEDLDNRGILAVELSWLGQNQKIRNVGINLNLWQWDSGGNRVTKRVYKELCIHARPLAKQALESRGLTLLEPGKRDRTDFQVIINAKKYNIDVIPKPSWGEEFVVTKLRVPNKPNTIFCFVNKPMTRMVVIEPQAIQDLAPLKKEVQEHGYIEVPNDENSNGLRRMKSINLGAKHVTSEARNNVQPVTTYSR